MKKIYSLLFLVVASVSFAQTIYTENFGTTAASASPYPLVTAYTGFQNATPIVYSGTGSVRTSGTLSNYNGASGGSHGYLGVTTGVGQVLQIDGINTSTFPVTNLQLIFGYLTSSIANQVVVEKSTDGTTWTPITYTNNTATSWTLVTVSGAQLPSSTTLSLRFTNPSTAAANPPQIRIDDVKVINADPSCTLVLGTPVSACDASTSGIDTYTTTISYTGAGSGTYTITPSSGTLSGDNPNTVAAGNIIISNVSEGTNINLSITKGACSYPLVISAPECKVVNTLPYSESFPYTAGSILGAQQKWTNFNGGDFVTVAANSLTYSGVTSSGNSITFVGAGAECATPFTPTTSGTIYAAFLMNVSDLTNVTDGNSDYFATLSGTSNSNYKTNVFTKRVGTQYQIGFDAASTTTNFDSILRNVGDVLYIVIGYDFALNAMSMWVNPTNGASPTLGVNPTTPFTTLGGFTLRQNTNVPTLVFDELRIVTTLAELGLTLGINQNNNITGLKIYPNPVSNGTLFIETAANAEKTVTVFDVLGKQVLNTTTSENAINVAILHTGVYIVNITEEGKTASRKLVIK